MRKRIHALAPDCDSYYQGVFVFTAARVEARFGDTGAVQAIDYIAGDKRLRRLKAGEIDALVKAFGALTRMEDGFDD